MLFSRQRLFSNTRPLTTAIPKTTCDILLIAAWLGCQLSKILGTRSWRGGLAVESTVLFWRT